MLEGAEEEEEEKKHGKRNSWIKSIMRKNYEYSQVVEEETIFS